MSTAVVPPRTTQSRTAALLDRLVCSISSHERSYLVLATTLLTLLVIYEALTKPIWFDEFFTLFISRLSSFHDMLRAMPADGQPPLQYLVEHPFLKCFGVTELSLRLPAILAWIAAGLLTWRVVRVHGTAVQALFALTTVLGATTGSLWLTGISVIGEAFTARPYQLVLAFTALAYLCWQTAAQRTAYRLVPLAGLTLAIAGAVLTHHFGILQIGAFLIPGEIVRFTRHRRLDLPVLIAAAAGLLPLIVTVPLAIQTHILIGIPVQSSLNYWAKPSLIDLFSWLTMTPWLIFLPVTFLACLPGSSSPQPCRSPLPPVPRHEIAAAVALVLLVPAQLLLSILKTGYFFPRYAIGSTFGFALLFAWALPISGFLRAHAQRVFALLSVSYLFAAATCLLIEPFIYPIGSAALVKNAVSPVSQNVPGDLPIVDANPYDYLQEYWYAPPALRRRLTYITDLPYAVRQPSFIPELSLVTDKDIAPFPVTDYAGFLATHARFYILRTGGERDNWLPQRLQKSGWRLTPLRQSGTGILYLADRP